MFIIDDPTVKKKAVSEVAKSELPKRRTGMSSYRTLRDARSEARLVGVRETRSKAKEEEAAAFTVR